VPVLADDDTVVHGNAEREAALAAAVDRPIDSKKLIC
jgi:hypothetical protein